MPDALTTVASLWNPSIWTDAVREDVAILPSVINSGIVRRSPVFDTLASGPSNEVNVPLYHDITDGSESVQIENSGVTAQNITAGVQIGVITNRVAKVAATAFAAQVSGSDPVGEMTRQFATWRLKRMQVQLIAMMRGLFGSDSTTGPGVNGAAYAPLRSDYFSETGASPTSNTLIDAEKIIDSIAVLGDLADSVEGGAMLIHPIIHASLQKLDKESFHIEVDSKLGFKIVTYRGIPVYRSQLLARAGTTSGKVYDSYIMAKGVIALGEKPQRVDGGFDTDTAIIQLAVDKDLNNTFLWDRTRSLMHWSGAAWSGTAADQNGGPTNTELQTPGNWSLIYATANRAGAVCIRTNG